MRTDYVAPGSRTLPDMLLRRVRKSGGRRAVLEKDASGRWQTTTWDDLYKYSAGVARGLVELGLAVGDRAAILGPTRAQWSYYDMGCQLAGLVSFGIYPQQTVEQLRYLLSHADARVLFVDGEDELERVVEAARGLDQLVAIVPWDEALAGRSSGKDPRITSPARFRGAPIEAAERDRRIGAVQPDDTAILIYTSGTTGPPKGAMISHTNIIAMLSSPDATADMNEDDLILSFLPMAHAAERVLGFYGRISTGMTTAYASSIGAVLTEVGEVQPTVFGSVPRIFEKAYARIRSDVAKKPPAVRRLFAWAEDVGRRRVRLVLEGKPVPLALEIQHGIADRVVFKKIRGVFGGKVRRFVTGAAPIAHEILELFWAAGLPIYEVYGMTEATVITHANRPGAVRLGSVGRPVAGIEHRIAEDGEVLLRGAWVFRGYYKNPEATAETVKDGWLYTGDIGRIDEDGYLYITDRKKHLIITAGGKNLTPANIENAIKTADPLISQVHAHGDRRAYVSAIVAPSPIETLEWGAERGLVAKDELDARTRELVANPSARSDALNAAMARVVTHPDFIERIRAAVRKGNQKLAHVEQVRRFRVLDRDFSQEQGELTPTMKLKRKEIEGKYAAVFDRIYGEESYGLEV